MDLFRPDNSLDESVAASLSDAQLVGEVEALETAYGAALAEYQASGKGGDAFDLLAARLHNLRRWLRACGEAAGTRRLVNVSEGS